MSDYVTPKMMADKIVSLFNRHKQATHRQTMVLTLQHMKELANRDILDDAFMEQFMLELRENNSILLAPAHSIFVFLHMDGLKGLDYLTDDDVDVWLFGSNV